MEIFKRLFKAFNEANVKYLVCGGIALNLYGIQRSTADIDIALSLDEDNLRRFISVANELGLKPKIPVKLDELLNPQKRREWITQKNSYICFNTDERENCKTTG